MTVQDGPNRATGKRPSGSGMTEMVAPETCSGNRRRG